MPWALAEERASFLFWLNKGTDCGNTGRLHTHQRSIKEEPTDMSEVIPTAMSYKEPPRLCSAAVRTPWRMTLRHAASAVVCAGQVGTVLYVAGLKSASHMTTQEAKSQGYCGPQYFISF